MQVPTKSCYISLIFTYLFYFSYETCHFLPYSSMSMHIKQVNFPGCILNACMRRLVSLSSFCGHCREVYLRKLRASGEHFCPGSFLWGSILLLPHKESKRSVSEHKHLLRCPKLGRVSSTSVNSQQHFITEYVFLHFLKNGLWISKGHEILMGKKNSPCIFVQYV